MEGRREPGACHLFPHAGGHGEGGGRVDPEGQKILSGLAFRIPTQKQNSIESFVIKQFLPKEFGDSVVIPAALVQKVGSDFDIDKLYIYLKNVIKRNGKLSPVPFFGFGEEAKKAIRKAYDEGEFLDDKQRKELDRFLVEETDEVRSKFFSNNFDEEGNVIDSPEDKLLRAIFAENLSIASLTKEFVAGLTKEKFINKLVDNLYKKSLQNAYITSSENLVLHPDNYERLILPNSAAELKKLSEEVAGETFDYGKVGNMLNRVAMTKLRHAFVSGKYAIGISAVNQTNHSLNQQSVITIDDSKLGDVPMGDSFWLDDASIKFKDYNSINGKPTLSMSKNAKGKYISDIIGQFIDGYVDISKGPWIMDLGASPNVSGTFMFLAKLGVPIDEVVYFMNQPIIRDYLRKIESAGYSWKSDDECSAV